MKQVREFFSAYPLRNHQAGEVVIRLDEPIANIYYLVEGRVAQYAAASDGSDFVVHIFRPGSFFPVAMVLANIPNRFTFKAKSRAVTRVAPAKEVMNFLDNNPKALYDLTKRVLRGLFGVVNRLEKALGLKAQERIMSLLTYLSESHGKDSAEGRKISFPLTHSDIASWLGLTRETVNRQMLALQKKKLISYHTKTITIIK